MAKLLPHNPDFSRQQKDFENIVGKGENAGIQHFLLFPQSFLPYKREKSLCQQHLFHQHFFLFPQCFVPYKREKSLCQQHLFRRLQMLSVWSSIKFCRVVNS